MYMNNLITNVLTLGGSGSSSHPETRVKYTQASGLADWEGDIVGEIVGQGSSPWYTTQIPNIQYANTVQIGNNVSSIGNSAFNGCSNLMYVAIPNIVTNIGDYAFSRCSMLMSITIPNSVTRIGENAFSNCTNLTSVTIGNGVTSIGANAFYGCSELTGIITIPNSVTVIGNASFTYCNNLVGINITNLEKWFDISFNGSQTPFYSAHNLYLNNEKITSLIIPNTVKNIPDYAFSGCIGLTSVTFSGSVTNIRNMAFYNCNNIINITFGGNIVKIFSESFRNCSNCTVFDFRRANTVPTLGGTSAFYDTPSNKEIIVPDSLYDSWKAATNWSSSTNNIVNCIVKASQSSLGTL